MAYKPVEQISPLFGPYGSAALPFIEQFERFDANALWFHGFDPIAFETCERYSILACVEFKTFRADFNEHPELIPIGVDGLPIRFGDLVQGVCLSQQAFLDETEAHLMEGLRQFQPAGVWLDYLTYAGWFETPDPDLQESCFCPACIREFCDVTGIDADTPQQILTTAAETWTRHKCERVAKFARQYANRIHETQPNCLVGAYMCPWTPEEYDGALRRIFAQDYQLLAPHIDVFTPLIYVHKSRRMKEWGYTFLSAVSQFVPAEKPVQLILDALDFPDSLLETARSPLPSWGIQMFGGSKVFADPEQSAIFARAVEQIRQKF